MKTLRAWITRLTGMFSKQDRERDFADEIESHVQMHVDDNLRAGMNPDEALRQALCSWEAWNRFARAIANGARFPSSKAWPRICVFRGDS